MELNWNDYRWLVASLLSSFLWAIADILCDACIGEEEEEMSIELMVMQGKYHEVSRRDKDSEHGDSDDEESAMRFDRNSNDDHEEFGKKITVNKNLDGKPKDDDDSSSQGSEEDSLTGTQDCAIAGFTTGVIMYGVAFKKLFDLEFRSTPRGESDIEFSQGSSRIFIWNPLEDIEWWFAAASGALMFYHYLSLLMAYDTAPSTVINPLLQVTSTWMLFATGVVAWFSGETFITMFDLVCYCIITFGGMLPSLNGDFRMMMTPAFWKQKFVKMTVISEITVILYDLLMTYVLRHVGKKEKFRFATTEDIEVEFFIISWVGFVITFCVQFGFHPWYRQEMIDLKFISKKILYISAFGQVITLIGYLVAQYAFTWYYQAGVVTAAEASLSQALNLVFAVVAFKCFGYGRESAVADLRIKVISCIVVTIGLFMLATTDAEPDAMP